MSDKLAIFGAGGHTRSLLALLDDTDYAIYGIYDNTYSKVKKEYINDYKVLGTINDFENENKIILSIGDNKIRKSLFDKYENQILNNSIIHSSAHLYNNVILGNSNFIFAKAFINSNVEIGDNNIINTGAIIEHETLIGSHNHISVGTILCGRVKIGNCCFIGAGSVVNDKVTICDNVTIGSNSTVINSIREAGVYVGSPARKIK